MRKWGLPIVDVECQQHVTDSAVDLRIQTCEVPEEHPVPKFVNEWTLRSFGAEKVTVANWHEAQKKIIAAFEAIEENFRVLRPVEWLLRWCPQREKVYFV